MGAAEPPGSSTALRRALPFPQSARCCCLGEPVAQLAGDGLGRGGDQLAAQRGRHRRVSARTARSSPNVRRRTPARRGRTQNGRFATALADAPNIAADVDDPKGVPIDAIIFGGSASDREPLIQVITDLADSGNLPDRDLTGRAQLAPARPPGAGHDAWHGPRSSAL
jgi:hypothetical protein